MNWNAKAVAEGVLSRVLGGRAANHLLQACAPRCVVLLHAGLERRSNPNLASQAIGEEAECTSNCSTPSSRP